MSDYTGRPQRSAEEIKAFLKEHAIETVRLGFTDLLGIQRGKLIPASNLSALLDASGDAFSVSTAVLTMGYDDAFVGVSFLPDTCDNMGIAADLSTLEVLPYEAHTAFVQCDILYKGKPLLAAPRTFLKWVVNQYHALGLEPICACEAEFYAYKRDAQGQRVPYAATPCNFYTVSRSADPDGLIRRIFDAARQMDFDLSCCNQEYHYGQFEFNWKHGPAVSAADKAALFKTISKDVAAQTGAEVCFMAKPAGTPVGSGYHFHISLNDRATGANLCSADGGLSPTARHMAAGILKHARAITPFMAPTVNCYKRYQPGAYAPVYVAWGMENRTCCIRVPEASPASARLEVRSASAACNPYLAIGALLLAGLDGIRRQEEPPAMTQANIYQDKAVQATLERLPENLGDALRLAKADPWLNEAFPKELLELFFALKEPEYARYMAAVTDWEMASYFTHA